jgi:hypothetical protein
MQLFKLMPFMTLCLFLVSSLASSQGPIGAASGTVNGCGSGWNQPIVPDRIKIAACEFKPACDTHDLCYGECDSSIVGKCEYRRCLKNGDLNGTQACFESPFLQNIVAARDRRLVCDINMRTGIGQLNANKSICVVFGWVYFEAVRLRGEVSFVGAGAGPVSKAILDNNDTQIERFIKDGTDAEFDKFIKALEENKGPNFRDSLRYRPGQGLGN